MAMNKVNGRQKKKLQTMILSVLLAVVVWFMVMSLTNPTITVTLNNLNIRFIGEMALKDKQLAITGRNEIPALSVTVRGNRSDLMNYMDDIYVQVDLSSIEAEGSYNLTGKISIPTTRISVERENYGEITVNAEPIISKELEVDIRQTGALAGKIVKSEARNPKVLISGAKSEIDDVAGAVASVDVSDINNEPRFVNYLLVNSAGTLITGNETIESPRSEIEIINTVYEEQTLSVEPVLSADMGKIYNLNREKTAVSPSVVKVGVREGAQYENVKAVIDRSADEEEGEYKLRSEENMYIPPETETVRIRAELESKDPAASSEDGDNTDGR